MKSVILHPEAEAEFEDAADYFEANRSGYGEVFRQEVADALAQIGSTPTVFSLYKGGPTRRRLIIRFGYAVYFVERDAAVHVVAIANQRRKPDYWQDRLNDV
jgi:plasmid stabilization system protein ParE